MVRAKNMFFSYNSYKLRKWTLNIEGTVTKDEYYFSTKMYNNLEQLMMILLGNGQKNYKSRYVFFLKSVECRCEQRELMHVWNIQ